MGIYFHTFDYTEEHIENIFFNPESILLRNVLEHKIKPALVDFPYALMRQLPFRIHEVSRVMREQEHIWWSRTDHLPSLSDLTSYFKDKLRSMEDALNGNVPQVLSFPFKISDYPEGDVWIEAKNDDNNPSKAIAAYFKSDNIVHTSHCVINNDYVEFQKDFQKHTFVFKEGDFYIFSQWRFVGNNFVNFKKSFPANNVMQGSPFSFNEMTDAWRIYDSLQESENQGHIIKRNVDKLFTEQELKKLPLHLKASLFFLSSVLDEKMKRKLQRNPIRFFEDAKNPISKKIGEFYMDAIKHK
ncbi:hypothetical protein GLI01_05600 [Gluconacetobacter liquefaciens]|uniref:Uncharacterized protein n=1 Tax=Gluconacetobacter liquefaciens TaxID=89584 RepID=A0A370G733_GLULI|nr:hypothetical protein [Gluconacetobacter liquefaciens]RDI38886.1 hypothetical protein C7453_103347 [Gluconacetobacter liquefaciens]GEB36525.1 hypothetical protein GLI01_05600 [Gluconacetobacter liquefaciens]